jgi:hypothetical protein
MLAIRIPINAFLIQKARVTRGEIQIIPRKT